jgi:hypothetical protein
MNSYRLVVNTVSVDGCHKNIGSYSGHIMHASLAACLTMPAGLICLCALFVPAISTHVFEVVFCEE